MNVAQRIDLRLLVDGANLSGYSFWVFFLLILAMFSDGYDYVSIAYAAPSLVKDWGIDRAALGPVFSSGVAGILIGGVTMGVLGDRAGRRAALIASMFFLGLVTLGTVSASSVGAIIFWRFLTGLGVGGIAPLCLVIANEYAPRRMRAMIGVAMFAGAGVGGMGVGGWLSSHFVPSYGWRLLFYFGGLVPLLVGALLLLGLPESLKFLFIKGARSLEIVKILRRLRRGIALDERSEFVWSGETPSARSTPYRLLFAGRRFFITLFLWIGFFFAQVTIFALTLWLPTLLQDAGLSTARVASAMLSFSACGIVGGLTISRFIDKFGIAALAALPFLGIPLVILVGIASQGSQMVAAVAATGFSVGGTVQGYSAISGFFYPTAIRASGVSMALFVSRFGAVLGPLALGWLMAKGATLQMVFYFCSVPLILSAAATLALAWSSRELLREEA